MTDIVERLTEYNKDWRTRAGSAKEVAEAIEEIKRLRGASPLSKEVELAERLEEWRSQEFPDVDARDLLSDADLVLIIHALKRAGKGT